MFLSHKKNRKENAIGSCDNTWLHCLDSLPCVHDGFVTLCVHPAAAFCLNQRKTKLGEERENNKKGQEKKKKKIDVEIKVVG